MPDQITDSPERPTLSPPPDYRDVPQAAGLPWWRYAFPTVVDAIVAAGIVALLWAGKLHADWLQALALVGLLLVAGVRAADLSSMMRGGSGVPPGAGPAALVLAGLGSLLAHGVGAAAGAGAGAAAVASVARGSTGRVRGEVLAAVAVALLAALLLPTLLKVSGGLH